MSASPSNVERLQRWYEAYERDGSEAAMEMVDELFDPEVEFSPLLAREIEGRSYHGRDGLRTFFGELNDALGELRYEDPEYRPVGDNTVVVFIRLVGSGRGSTVPISQDLALVYEFRGDLVRRFTAYGSRDEALSAAQEMQRA